MREEKQNKTQRMSWKLSEEHISRMREWLINCVQFCYRSRLGLNIDIELSNLKVSRTSTPAILVERSI